MVLDWYMNLPREGVFVIENEATRCFYINYSTSIGQSLARLYDQWNGKPRAGNLDLKMLVVTSDPDTLKLHTEYWRDRYRNMGWTELGAAGRKSLQYKVRCVVAPDFSCMEVRLVTARGDSKVVGRFKTAGEAQDFVQVNYGSDNPYCFPVYAANSDTKEYLARREADRLRL